MRIGTATTERRPMQPQCVSDDPKSQSYVRTAVRPTGLSVFLWTSFCAVSRLPRTAFGCASPMRDRPEVQLFEVGQIDGGRIGSTAWNITSTSASTAQLSIGDPLFFLRCPSRDVVSINCLYPPPQVVRLMAVELFAKRLFGRRFMASLSLVILADC
jgi:hypothetical protein